MSAVVRGSVVRFDPVKGYGFISQHGGGDDVFLHVNDLLDDKHLIRSGTVVEFVVEPGERGLKASSVHVVSQAPLAVVDAVEFAEPVERPEDAGGDVLSASAFAHEVTEVLLSAEPGLTGAQILRVREAWARRARTHGWIR